jgi:hypothetical protein
MTEEERVALARDPMTPDPVLRDMAMVLSQSRAVKCAIASNPNASLKTLDLVMDCHEEVLNNPAFQLALLDNPRALDDLAGAEKLLGSDGLDDCLMELLATHPLLSTRIEAAQYRRMPAHLLALLADDHFWMLRSLVAAHSNTSEDVLRRLSTDLDPDVRTNVAGNDHTPEPVLMVLHYDRDFRVADRARQSLQDRKNM